jgi:hypothetical protein
MIFKKLLGVKSSKAKENRKAFRVVIPNLRAKVTGKPMSFSVRDLSATGVALNVSGRVFQVDSLTEINLFAGNKMLVGSLKARVVRLGDGFVGMNFEDLTRQQSKTLHEVCLEEQKKLAEIKKKQEQQAAKAKEAANGKKEGKSASNKSGGGAAAKG